MRFTLPLILLFLATAPVHAEALDELRSQIDALAQPLIERKLIVGVSIGVARGEHSALLHYGETASGGGQTPTDDSVYEIGSISKTFTGVLLADAVRRGEVHLDDPVVKYLPQGVTVPQHGRLKVTLLGLTTHSSGLPRMPGNFSPADPGNPYADYTFDRMYAFLSSHELRRRPGEAFEYSNLGAALLGHALERETGERYEQLMLDRLATPLGMTDTRIALTDDMLRRLVPGHNADGEPASNWDLVTFAGAGGIRSTPRDILKYLLANRDAEGEPLGPAMRESHQPQFPVGGNTSIGMGWFTNGYDTWHNGQTGGYCSFAWFHPPTKTAAVVLANTTTPLVDALGWRVATLTVGKPIEPLDLPPMPIDLPPEKLDALIGTYGNAPTYAFQITRQGDRLYARLADQPAFRIYPTTETAFEYHAIKARIDFELGEGGRATKLTLHQNGLALPFPRLEETE